MAETSSNQVVLDYTSRDFDAVRSMLVGLARGRFPEWTTVGEAADFGTVLLEMMAYASDVLNFYIDRVGAEAFLGTAVRRQSVLWMADMLGYRPIGQQAASTVLNVALAPTAEVQSFTLPAGTRISSSEDTTVVFETDFDVTVTKGQQAVVTATEGTTTQASLGVAKGVPNAEFVLPDRGVVFQSIVVRTNEAHRLVEWSQVDRIVTARPSQSAFSAYVDDEGYTHLLFGDNAAGRIPPAGIDLVATYRHGIGAAANDIGPGVINSPQMSVPAGFTVANVDRPLGGADPESVESMRHSIPRSTGVQDRAVTLADYQSLAVRVPGVARAVAYGQVYSAVTVRIAPVGGAAAVSEDQMVQLRTSVEADLRSKSLLGAHVFVEDVYQHNNQGWDDVVLDLDVYVLPGYSRNQVVSRVAARVEELFAFDNVDFGKRISIGDVYRSATNVDGVDYVEINSLYASRSTPGQVSNIVPIDRRIPRIRPQQISEDGTTILTEYGLVVTGFGGLNV